MWLQAELSERADGYIWEEFQKSPAFTSSYVTISVIEAYVTNYINSFVHVEVYAGMNSYTFSTFFTYYMHT